MCFQVAPDKKYYTVKCQIDHWIWMCVCVSTRNVCRLCAFKLLRQMSDRSLDMDAYTRTCASGVNMECVDLCASKLYLKKVSY